jgi:hypothetical protein
VKKFATSHTNILNIEMEFATNSEFLEYVMYMTGADMLNVRFLASKHFLIRGFDLDNLKRPLFVMKVTRDDN